MFGWLASKGGVKLDLLSTAEDRNVESELRLASNTIVVGAGRSQESS